jgi:hypothetical protein
MATSIKSHQVASAVPKPKQAHESGNEKYGRRPMESARGPRMSVPIIDPAKRHEVMDHTIERSHSSFKTMVRREENDLHGVGGKTEARGNERTTY